MPLSKTTISHFELFTIETGDFMLDGGAMFGVVPKTLWSRGIAADEKNRIPMTMRCLLIRSKKTDRVYLIDNGAGTKFSEKMENIYQLDYRSKNLTASLEEHGFSASDITDMVFTHLHFDHCGGSSFYNDENELQLTFPEATHHVLKSHWDNATQPNAREKASFLPENIEPLARMAKLNLVEEGHIFEEGFSTIVANGHTVGQMLPRITGDGQTLVFTADLLPTHVHVPLPWVMGYDMYPAQTLSEKEEFLNTAAEEKWFLYLEHDIQAEVITIEKEGHKYKASEPMTLNSL